MSSHANVNSMHSKFDISKKPSTINVMSKDLTDSNHNRAFETVSKQAEKLYWYIYSTFGLFFKRF